MNDIEVKLSQHFKGIMELLEIPFDDSTIDTPDRIAKMYYRELFHGLRKETYPKITTVENKFNYNQMIVIKDIKIHSLCEHHFVPFLGTAKIAYIPDKKVLGLSKFNRICDYWSRRPQIQERLTTQIHEDLTSKLETKNVAVLVEAEHLCVKLRGVKDQNSKTVTSMLTGSFYDNAECRAEFMALK
jgi:GTP cyclohydrolase I